MIDVRWDDPQKTIVLLDFKPPLMSWGEYRVAVDEAAALVGSVDHDVYVIFNSGITQMPPGNPFEPLRYSAETIPSNAVCLYTVLTNIVAEHMLKIVLRTSILRERRLFKTMDEAYADIEARRASKNTNA